MVPILLRANLQKQYIVRHSMNTGLVFRSNADGTSYFSLSILAVKQGVKGTDLIRVCYGTDAHISSEDHCMRIDGDTISVWNRFQYW